jgi:similar to stage IV sporulation protein
MKTTYKIEIIDRFGISRYKYLFKKYYLFIICFIIGIIINIFLSNIIFKIEVDNPDTSLVKTIIYDLDKYGIRKYKFKVSYNKLQSIKKNILEKEKDKIEWLEIEEIGTKYKISVEERKININNSTCNSRHIISKKNALITSIRASSGEIVKKVNDYVSQGEIIVSGVIYNKDKAVSLKCATGVVYGEVWYKVKVNIPKNYIIKKDTGNYSYGIKFKLLKKEYNLLNNYLLYKNNVYNIIESKIIPISFGISKYKEEKIIKYDINTLAINKAVNKIKKNLNEDDVVLSKKVLKKRVNNSKIEVEVFIKVNENITDYLDITDLDINELNKEEE